MPDRRRHRGPHPEDRGLFAPEALERLKLAVEEFSWLLDRGYAGDSALKLTGDRHQLTSRQRVAVLRCSGSDGAIDARKAKRADINDLRGKVLLVDGFNFLITVESALAGGLVLVGRDGAYRELASLHGTYRRVEETPQAIDLAGRFLARTSPAAVKWLLDAPVSNSGRLLVLLRRAAQDAGWPWDAELAADPDRVLAEADGVVASSDSVVLDRCRRWVNLAGELVRASVPDAWVVDLRMAAEDNASR
jgi:hypothetical protein